MPTTHQNKEKGLNKTMINENNRSSFHTLEEFDREESGRADFVGTLYPAFSDNNIAVAIVSSNEYAPFASVLIASLIANATERNNYDIVLMTNDMLINNRQRIEKMRDGHANISIRIFDISQMVVGLSFYTWAHFTSNTYYRLLTPDIFAEYEKVIYLDSDVVVNHDIAELFHTDVEGFFLAAAYDTHVIAYCTQNPPLEQRDYNVKTLGLKKPEEYFQAGVALFNIKAFRMNFEKGYLIKQGQASKLRWLDQDLINMLFYGKIKPISNKWNVMINNQPENLDEYYLPPNLRKKYYEARQDPYIVHYVGKAIPCYTTTPDLFEYFWKYARHTDFYEILFQKMMNKNIEEFTESVHIQTKEPFIQKFKRHLRALSIRILPIGSHRRIFIKKFIFRFKKWKG